MDHPDSADALAELQRILDQRKGGDPETSYVASLHARGLNKILEKLGEEATETILAAKDGDRQALIGETADLWFHIMVMLSHQGLSVGDIIDELQRRSGISGHEEKASRTS